MTDTSDIFMKAARKCKRCGRLLFSEEALKTGYGCQCAKKSQQEEIERQPISGQMNIMDYLAGNNEEENTESED